MANSDTETVVEDPIAPGAKSPSVVSNRVVDAAVMIGLLGLAVLLGYDNYRTGMSWEDTGPQAGYMPFYLSVILAGAALYGLGSALLSRDEAAVDAFVTRAQLRRVMQVLFPTFLFVLATAWLGLYVASFLLISGFMWGIGRIAIWQSILTALLLTAVMFFTFQLAFEVILPKGPLEAAFGY
ncbi:MAG: tripartite tricarboxylate transporter TctB family protein [Xanthobacteraceae bacterium]|nr:tripartite tricarboxylate transporter TctB family protein [Xanthobacteraceae bacterium]